MGLTESASPAVPPVRSRIITGPRPQTPRLVSRRSFLKSAVFGALAAGPLAACSSGGGATELRFYQSKPEVVGYFDELIAAFNSEQSEVLVTHDATSSLVASLVREAPHDLVCNNYDLYAGTFVARDVLTDLGGLPEAERIDPSVQALVGQYATPEQATSVLPYSIAAAGVICNQDYFEEHGVDVPTTWSELIDACETFMSADITPIYMTFRDPWTIRQGLFDYVSGSMMDVAGFYERLKAQGPSDGSGSDVSFQESFKPATEKMLELLAYANNDAPSRVYVDGNAAFAQGAAAMYLQGPWAIGEIAKVNPDLTVRTFPLPATEDPADVRVRVNLDLALWIPKGAAEPEAARQFLSFLMRPDVMDTYNGDNLAVSPTVDAPAVEDERLAGLGPYVAEGAFYQGAGTYIPDTIPSNNYLQEFVISRDADALLRKLDNDWQRLARRSFV
jgi:raffinose/stachyose/melibiose transport system substrate-binding protein